MAHYIISDIIIQLLLQLFGAPIQIQKTLSWITHNYTEQGIYIMKENIIPDEKTSSLPQSPL